VDEHLKETAVDKLGADMYLLKHTPNPQILETITQLGLKEPYRYKDELFVLAQNKQPLYNRRMLTDREKQILGLVALGYTREQIAEILTVTAGTIGVQLNSIYKKMGVSNKMEAIALARTNKIIPH
jgi:DNA-binding NarL/FixJ family response regulator